MTLPFLLGVITYNSYVLWWYSWGSLPAVTGPGEGVDINSRAPTPGCSLIQDYFGEAFCLHSIPYNMGEAGIEFIFSNGQKISREAMPMAIPVTYGVGEGNLGVVTTFCCHNQAKMEASNALSTLHQCDSPQPSVIVMRGYTSTPYIPQGPPVSPT